MTVELMPDAEPISCRLVTRISNDPNDKRTGVTRQRTEGRALASRLNWIIEREHCDNNRSGWKYGVVREGYEVLLQDIRAGRVRAVLAFDQDRITRQTEQWAQFRRLCKKHSVRVAFVNDGGEVPISTVSGGLSTGLRALLAEGESDTKSDKVLAASRERAMAGKAAGRVLYGWRRVVTFDERGNRLAWRDEIDPAHAEIVRSIAADLLAGKSLRHICAVLDERGIPTPNAGRANAAKAGWTVPTVRNLMRRPANIGQRVHHGEVLAGVTAQAEPILDRATFRRVDALLADPARRTITDNRLRHLLTNIALCGVCGGPMRFKRQRSRDHVTEMYTCELRGCVGRKAELVDTVVSETIIRYLGTVGSSALRPAENDDVDDAAEAKADDLRRVLDENDEDRANLRITREHYLRVAALVQPQIDALQARRFMAASPGLDLARHFAASGASAMAWQKMTLIQQRAVIDAIYEVTVHRGANPRRFDPTLIHCKPRH